MKQIGKGLTAEVFELSEDKVIKLFNKGYPKQAIRREFRNASLVNSFKINGPQAVVHGDFHPLNVFVEEDGDLKVIDFMNMRRSPAEYDIARTYFLIGAVSAEFAEAYLSVMGYTADEISDYVELVKLYRKLEG